MLIEKNVLHAKLPLQLLGPRTTLKIGYEFAATP